MHPPINLGKVSCEQYKDLAVRLLKWLYPIYFPSFNKT